MAACRAWHSGFAAQLLMMEKQCHDNGNVLLALQLNLPISPLPGVTIEEQNAEAYAAWLA